MHQAAAWQFSRFENGDLLDALVPSTQRNYLRNYLADLGASEVLCEESYFDRDYLAEFAAFYGMSARGYTNLCKRLLFFKALPAGLEATLSSALGGDDEAFNAVGDAFLGFVIQRPIPSAQIGRTVVRWYPDHPTKASRVVTPSRRYFAHVAGLPLAVDGLAWQQQDTGVSACATVAIWTMLHSRAFHEQHAVPTTVAITEAALRASSGGQRAFPSNGLTRQQVMQAIKELGYQPVAMAGDISRAADLPLFSRERFCGTLAAAIESGFPVLLCGTINGNGHAACAVGFRTAISSLPPSGECLLADRDFDALYVHDDNLGPGVRFCIKANADDAGAITLFTSTPDRPEVTNNYADPTLGYEFVPDGMILAVHSDVRSDYDHVHHEGKKIARSYARNIVELEDILRTKNVDWPEAGTLGVEVKVCIFKLRTYLSDVLEKTITDISLRSKTRRALCESVAPMSLHVAVIRILIGGLPAVDLLCDTSDNLSDLHIFAHVNFTDLAEIVAPERELGEEIRAFRWAPTV